MFVFRFVLASASPRRLELLRQIGVDVEVIVSDVDENLSEDIPARELVEKLARVKAQEVAKRVPRGLIIGADTVVVADNNILGKPRDYNHAVEMLQLLNGRAHSVITGVAIIETPSYGTISAFEETRVLFRKLTDEEIHAYVKTNEPIDKAGSYGIQGIGALLVEKIEGDYFNVVGLPLQRLNNMLTFWNINLLSNR